MKDKNDAKKQNIEIERPHAQISELRRVLPQVLACSANNLILFDNCLVLSFPTIVIAALLNIPGELTFNEDEASWFASISLICQPVGSLFSGMAMEPLGRKRSMMLLNLPFLAGWLIVHFAQNIEMLYLAAAIMGFSVGCTEAPILTYVGEISEPKYRGTLASYAQLCGSLGYFVVYLLGTLMSWRNTAIFCGCIPVATFLAIIMVPETPLWLISRGRVDDAEAALCWLRGWAQPEDVTDELEGMLLYHKEMTTGLNLKKSRVGESQEELISASDMSLCQKFSYFLRPQMTKPLFLIISYFFFFYASGFQTIRPYLVPVLKNLNSQVDAENTTVVIAIVGVGGFTACMVLVKMIGKRAITFLSLGGCAVSTFLLAAVSGNILQPSWTYSVMLFYSFVSSLGVGPIPWMLQSELYPFQGKCLAAGIAAAGAYIIGFGATKTYLVLQSFLSLFGVFLLFGALSVFGCIMMYWFLPETEGRSFDEIAEHFSKPQKAKDNVDSNVQ